MSFTITTTLYNIRYNSKEQKCLRHAPSEKLLIVKVKTIEIAVHLWFSSYSL